MPHRSWLVRLLPALPVAAVLPLAGCSDHPHHYREHERVIVREPVREDPIYIEGDVPEPPRRVETVTVRPYETAVWHEGHWVREGHRWVWVRGYWR